MLNFDSYNPRKTYPLTDLNTLIITGLASIIGLILFVMSYRSIAKNHSNRNGKFLFIMAIVFTMVGLLPTFVLFLLMLANTTSKYKY